MSRKNALAIPIACAFLAMGIAAGWQALVARYDYGGNWTAFFRIGSHTAMPAIAAQEHLYIFEGPGSDGYDGQFYRLIAQDPLLLRGTGRYMDAPRLRYRRILLPGLAWVMALGRPKAATYTYIAAVIAFIGLGAYWLSRYAVRAGGSAWWGLAFLCVPGVFLSVDRLTVDVALASLTAGCALYWREGSFAKLYTVLLFAPLAKDMGFLLLAGYCLYALFHRHGTKALVIATAGIPTVLWWLYVQGRTPDYSTGWVQFPFQGLLHNMLHPELYPQRAWFITPFEYLAWIGMIVAIAMGVARWNKDKPLCMAACLIALMAAVMNDGVWIEPESFGRTFTPLLMLLPMERFAKWSFVPLLAVLPRAATLPLSETVSVVRHFFAH